MDPRIAPLADIFRMNTRLFRNCLAGLTDEQAAERPSRSTNNAAYIAAHVVEARSFLLKMLGGTQPSPIWADLADARKIDEVRRFPPLAEMLDAWTRVSHGLRDRIAAMTAAELDAAVQSPFPLPVSDPSAIGLLTFFAQHDSYHIGQLAMLRKHAGLPAMQYA